MKKLLLSLFVIFAITNLNAQTVIRYNSLNKSRFDTASFFKPQTYAATNITYDTTTNAITNVLPQNSTSNKIAEYTKKLKEDTAFINSQTKALTNLIGTSSELIRNKALEIESNEKKRTGIKNKEKEKELDSIIDKLKSEKAQYEIEQKKLQNQIDAEKDKLENIKKEYNSIIADNKKQSDALVKENLELNKQIIGFIKELYKRDSVQINTDFANLYKSLTTVTNDLTKLADSLKPEYIFSHFAIDTSKIRNITNKLFGLTIKANDCKHILSKQTSIIKELEPTIKDYNSLGTIIQHLPETTFAEILKKEYPQKKLHVNEVFNQYIAAEKEFKKYYDEFLSFYKTEVDLIKSNLKIEDKETTDAAILANFTKPFGKSAAIIPEIDLLASKAVSLDEYGILAQTRLFVAATGSDTTRLNSANNFFIPEASQLGFMADFTFSFINAGSKGANDKKKLGINLGFYYLQKQLLSNEASKDPTPFSVGVLQARIGAEYILIKNMLAIYARMNGIHVGSGLDNFKKYYNGSDKLEWYSEFGLLSYLNLTSDKKTNILLEFRFVPVNSYVKSITQTNENYLSLFKVGIVKDFKF